MEKPWYESWFSSPYYELLYMHRNEEEAKEFLTKLLPMISLQTGAKILDAPCGSGRHCRALRGYGFHVTGIDLSETSIRSARKQALPDEEYLIHDMRRPFRTSYFDIVLNLFTSLGYGKKTDDDRILKMFKDALVPGGLVVLDFLNTELCAPCEAVTENRSFGQVDFKIIKECDGKFIRKNIIVNDAGREFLFQESLITYSPSILRAMLLNAGFKVLHTFGDYQLSCFDTSVSPRVIFVAEKYQ